MAAISGLHLFMLAARKCRQHLKEVKMRTIILQDDEADKLECLIDALLADPDSKALHDGKIRRTLRRITMKLHWARKKQDEECKAA